MDPTPQIPSALAELIEEADQGEWLSLEGAFCFRQRDQCYGQ